MPRVSDLKVQFNAGEFSPRMVARTDFGKYPGGCATVKNMIPLPQGGLARRPGTRYVAEVKDSEAKTRLLRFEFSTEQAYVIEAGNGYFRFYRNQGRITVPETDASITNGTFDSAISGWTDRSSGSGSIAHDGTNNDMDMDPGASTASDIAWAEQQVTNTSAVEHVLKFRVRGSPGDKIELRVGTTSTGTELVNDVEFQTGYHAYAFTATAADFYVQFRALGTDQNKIVSIDDVSLIDNAPMELDAPYATADLFTLKSAQSADVMYISHLSYPVHKLTRSGHTSWSLIQVAWDDGSYLDENATATTLAPSATSGVGITVTASATKGINKGDGFKSTDVGRMIRIQHGTNEPGYAVITAFTDTTHVTADVKRNFNATTASAKWRLGSWSQTTGYPATVGFFEQRLAAARTSDQPQSFWLSQSADIENMRADSYDSGDIVEDDDALDYTFAAEEVNAILWMSPGQQLVIGTTGGEWVVVSDGPVITPTDIDVKRHTTHGSADVMPVRVGSVVLFLQKAKRKVREFTYSFEADGYRAPDMTVLSDHITYGGINEIAYQQEPESIIHCVRADGVMIGMTYRRGQDVVGWGRTELGGVCDGGCARVETVTAIPGTDGPGQVQDSTERDELWVIVKRTINGGTKRFVEVLERSFEGPFRHDYASDAAWEAAMLEAQKDAYFVDSCLTLDSPVAISGATAADPIVVTATAHGFADGDEVEIAEVRGMTELNGITYKIANKTNDTFELTDLNDADIDGTGFTTYISGGKARKKVATVSGLVHLEGETLKVLADGAVHPDKTVSSGAITLDYKAGRVTAGLGYTHQFESLKFTSGTASGTALGKVKRISSVTLVLLDSAACKIGPNTENLKDVTFREVGDAMDTAVPLFTGEKHVEFDADYERDQRICIESDNPAPFTLLALAPEMKTSDPP